MPDLTFAECTEQLKSDIGFAAIYHRHMQKATEQDFL